MAVVVQCYHCANILELDDGFRGGVCRCSQCGALLQVPKESGSQARQSRPAAPDAPPSSAAGRPAAPGDAGGLSRGQFDPRSHTKPGGAAGAATGSVPGTGSGAFARSSGRMESPAAVAAARAASIDIGLSMHRPNLQRPVKKSNTVLAMALIAGLVIIIIAGIIVGAEIIHKSANANAPGYSGSTGAGGNESPPTGQDHGVNPPVAPAIAGPNFLGIIPLTGKRILFSLDAGFSNSDSFDYVRKGVALAAQTMAPDQQYRIGVWKESTVTFSPASGFAAHDDKKPLDDLEKVNPMGASDPSVALKASVDTDADQIIVVTAKPDLSGDMATAALAAKKRGQEVDAVKLISEDTDSPLVKLAQEANGKFRQMTLDELANAVRDK